MKNLVIPMALLLALSVPALAQQGGGPNKGGNEGDGPPGRGEQR